MKARLPQTAALAAIFLLAAGAAARSDTILPNGTYTYEMSGSTATRFADRITVSRATNGVVVREDSMLDGGPTSTERQLDPSTFSLLAYGKAGAALPLDKLKLPAAAEPGAPSAFYDFLPASYVLLPALMHASGATTFNLYFYPILGGDPEVHAVTFSRSDVPRPAGVPANDVAISMGERSSDTVTIWYDPKTFVTSAVGSNKGAMFRLKTPDERQAVATFPIEWDYAPVSVDVHVATQKWHMLLDVSSDLYVSPAAARAAGLTVTPAGSNAGMTTVPEIDLGFVGSVALHDVKAGIVDMDRTGFDGIIGGPILSSYRAVVDIKNRAMALFAFDGSPLTGSVVPLTLAEGKYPVIQATLGATPVRLAVVMSSGDEVALARPFAVKHGLRANAYTLKLGTLSVKAKVKVDKDNPGGVVDGTIGMGLLSAYKMEFDYSQRKMALTP